MGDDMNEFLVPAGSGESELTEKRSRFLGHLRKVQSEEEAKAFISEVKKTWHDARHNCWCYRIHDGVERFSDDGEPQGSAGMPMLEVLRKENVSDVVCVVTRYFGGVLLGTGGLSRAYSQAAKESLTDAGTMATGFWREVSFRCPYALLDRYKNELKLFGAAADYDYGAEVTVRARIPEEEANALADRIRELSGGKTAAEISEAFLQST